MSGWEKVIGHQEVVNYMRKCAHGGDPSHAYIVSGAQGSGKSLLADLFARALTCEAEDDKPCMKCHACIQANAGSQPDIIHVRHEKPKTISVEEIRAQVVEDITVRPYARPYKVYIIEEAEKMTEQAQNALLKTLEEPPAYGIVLLLTTNPEALLPTVRSRCVLLTLRGLKDGQIAYYLREEMKVEEEKIALCTAFARGSLGRAVMLAGSESFADIRMDVVCLMHRLKTMTPIEAAEYMKQVSDYKLDMTDYFDVLAVWYRDVLMFKATNEIDRLVFQDETRLIREQAQKSSYAGIEKILEELKKAQNRLRANVNFDLVLELLILAMKEN